MGEKTIVFWAEEGYMKIFSKMWKEKAKPKYAKIYLRATDAPKFISVLHENHLIEEDCGSEIIEFDLKKKEIKDISFNFNISRNFLNCIYLLTKYNSKNHEKDEESKAIKEKLVFVGMEAETGAIDILSKEKVENIAPAELSNYSSIKWVEPPNKQLEKEVERIVKKVYHIKKAKRILEGSGLI